MADICRWKIRSCGWRTPFHARARRVVSVNYRVTVATTTLPLLTRQGPERPVWRVVGHGEDRRSLAALPKPL